MPTQPCVIRPRRSTSVISMKTSPAPELASMPRWVMCQSPTTPSLAEYWHIGATLMRLASSRPLILYGEKSALVMVKTRVGRSDGGTADHSGRWQSHKSRKPRHSERKGLRARDQRVDHQVFVRRMRLRPDRADRADRGCADAGGEAGIRATAGELA